jgi:hypothetical protein
MSVRVVETGKHALKSEVDFSRARGSQGKHVVIRADGQKSATSNGHSLSSRLGFVHRPDVSIIQNSLRLFRAQERQRKQAAHTLHEVSSRKLSHREHLQEIPGMIWATTAALTGYIRTAKLVKQTGTIQVNAWRALLLKKANLCDFKARRACSVGCGRSDGQTGRNASGLADAHLVSA